MYKRLASVLAPIQVDASVDAKHSYHIVNFSSSAFQLLNFAGYANSHKRNFYNARLAALDVEAIGRNLVFRIG